MKYFRFVIVGDFEIERNSQSCAMYCTKSDTCLCTVEICATAWQNKPCKNCLPWPEAGCFSVTRLDKFSPIGQTFIIFGDQFLLGRLAILGQIYKLAQNLFILALVSGNLQGNESESQQCGMTLNCLVRPRSQWFLSITFIMIVYWNNINIINREFTHYRISLST